MVHTGRKQQLLGDGVVGIPWDFGALSGTSEDPTASRANNSVCVSRAQHGRE
jgi:hypothetical protein